MQSAYTSFSPRQWRRHGALRRYQDPRLSPQVTALLLSPIATELPETMNAIIWVRQGIERLALANISGAVLSQVEWLYGVFGVIALEFIDRRGTFPF